MHATIAELLCERVERSTGAALWHSRGGQFEHWTWPQLREQAARTAAALGRLQIGAGDRVAQWAANCPQWIAADLALHLLGAVHVPIHAPLTAAQASQQAQHCGAKALLVQHAEQAAGLADRWRPPHCLLYDDPAPDGWKSLEQLRQAVSDDQWQDVWNQAPERSSADSLATILYTSGTTGEPKGVMLAQSNLVSNATAMCRLFPSTPESLRLCLLPLSHVFARTCDLYVWLAGAGQTALAQARETVVADCQQLRPTSLNGVPYFFQKLQLAVEAGAAPDIRTLLGGRVEYCCSGGAPLPTDTYDYFRLQDVPIYQGYGLTETSPVISAATIPADRRGSVGRPIPDVDVRIADGGEVQTRGPHVMRGYYRDLAATEAVFDDGWLKTGDLGRIDEDGYLYITGRRKELIVTSSGKNIAPVLIESLLTADPLIEQAMVIGEGRSHLTALIVAASTAAGDAPQDPEPLPQRIAAAIDKRLAELSHHEQVRNFILLPRAFSLEHGELTPKLSLRREQIEENWRAEIEALYER